MDLSSGQVLAELLEADRRRCSNEWKSPDEFAVWLFRAAAEPRPSQENGRYEKRSAANLPNKEFRMPCGR